MTGEEMERAIEFLLQNQATLEQRVEQTQAQIADLGHVVRMQADSQGQLNQILTQTMINLAEAQAKTLEKVDRLAGLVERLAGGQG